MLIRLIKNDRNVKLYIMKEHIHGFCNMDTKFIGIDEFKRGTEITINMFRELFYQNEVLKQNGNSQLVEVA